MTETAKKPIRKATTKEILQIDSMLRQHLVKTPEGLYAYVDDWSDAKIAVTVDPSGFLSANAVARIRLEVFGALKPANGNATLVAELDELRKQVGDISRRLSVIEAERAKPAPQATAGEQARCGMTTRALTILNEQGDVTIVWTEEDDDRMEAIIEKKMKEGISFFIIEPRFLGVLPPRKSVLTDAADARKHRALAVKDEDFAAFVGVGTADVIKTPAKPVKTVRRAKNAKEVAKGESVGVRQMRGG